MAKTITTQEAMISTVSVQIRALTLGNKQMTQAVYRQILTQALVEWETMRFVGTPWGLVNYCPLARRGCHEEQHIHVVWACSSDLRKDVIFMDPSDDRRLFEKKFSVQQYSEVYKQMNLLPQLFIAV